MKTTFHSLLKGNTRRERAIALITVVSMVAIMTIFILALFSMSKSEQVSARSNAETERAREYADTAINMVMGQIWEGTKHQGPNYLWASQPGAIRKYTNGGAFVSGYRLYSSPDMQVGGAENLMVADAPPAGWANQPAIYTDLNEPVVKPEAAVGGGVLGGTKLYFPIIDPRSYIRGTDGQPNSTNVEGFWYANNFNGVRDPFGINDVNGRLPMPVQWLYLLKDGTVGSMGAGGGFVGGGGGAPPSLKNPIVARVAFWTDDETCKLNINTASEPTHWAVPTFYHRRDQSWANYQPTAFEYQRFPGHPATVAMSTVLFPNQNMDSYSLSNDPSLAAAFNALKDRKERIYKIAPKINSGGSQAGSLPYWRFTDSDYDGNGSIDNANNQLEMVSIASSVKERLYASVDELIFSETVTPTGRLLNDAEGGAGAIFGDMNQIDRSRFFLTAHSRMPELNMFGLPRVAIWPVASDTLGAGYRTGYDQLIAYCSTLGPPGGTNKYYFQRQDSQSPTTDINIARNIQLLDYLEAMMGRDFPGGGKFSIKYGLDSKQILVEIFDYIRSTNLYDGFLAPDKEVLASNNGNYATEKITNGTNEIHNEGNYYRKRDQLKNGQVFKTYTADRMSRSRGEGTDEQRRVERLIDKSYPGHGQVIPSELGGNGGQRGFGRFVTLTEIGFHFICTADGNNDKGSFRLRNSNGEVPGYPGEDAVQGDPRFSGGRTAIRIKPEPYGDQGGIGPATAEVVNWVNGQRQVISAGDPDKFKKGQWDVWYSNYPPFPSAGKYGQGTNVNNHPGYDGRNWNITLPINIALNPKEKRVQMMLQMEFTTPSAGYTKIHPDFSVVVTGGSGYKLNGQNLFPSGAAGILRWKSGRETMDHDGSRGSGGSFTGAAMGAGRSARTPGARMPADPDYDLTANASGDIHRGLKNFDLVSNFITVSGETMNFSGQGMTVEIYAGHQITGASPIQVITIPPPPSNIELPVPQLVTLSADNEHSRDGNGNHHYQKIQDAPTWWAFNFGGAIGRFSRTGGLEAIIRDNTIRNRQLSNPESWGARTYGRLASWSGVTDRVGHRNAPRGGAAMFGYDAASGNFNNTLLDPISPRADSSAFGDVYSETGLADMNSGTTPRRGVSQGKKYSNDMRGTDVVFTFVPAHNDIRLLMAKKVVPASDWVIHPKVDNLLQANGQFYAHNLARYDTNSEVAFDPGSSRLKLVPDANYNAAKRPDTSADGVYALPINLAKRYGDFDNGPGTMRDGAWINKPDEGNTPVHYRQITNGEVYRTSTAYLDERQEQGAGESPGENFMTPNRMIPSPGMFGSLPAGVNANDPWRTLLFRPHTARAGSTNTNHPGGPAYAGGISPADHYIMDLFWMPVVEPYAISEPFSTAGKVNLNYQMVPFNNYIRRATGIHAVMKGELISCVSKVHANIYKTGPEARALTSNDQVPFYEIQGNQAQGGVPSGELYYARGAWRDSVSGTPGDQRYLTGTSNGLRFFHRKILVEKRPTANAATVQGTLTQFEDKFNFVNATAPGLFRTASQICEIDLIPEKVTGQAGNQTLQGSDPNPAVPWTKGNIASFWSYNAADVNATKEITGDNTRERPYANIYGKITTQSNTYRVHFRSQAIRKARSVDPAEFDADKDTVSGDFRGSALIERYVDLNNAALPNFAPGAAGNLDAFYRFRVLELKRFNP